MKTRLQKPNPESRIPKRPIGYWLSAIGYYRPSALRPLTSALCLLTSALCPPAFAQGTAFTYQGRVRVNTADFTGVGQFKFALVTSTNSSRQAVAAATVSGGFLTIVTINDGGAGYVSSPAVTAVGGGGSGAVLTASISGGVVTNITVNNPGSGYTSNPAIVIAPPPDNIIYTTYWSNDGTSSAGSEPSTAVSAPVNAGLLTIILGNTSLSNMQVIGTSVFDQTNLQLRIWFNDGTNGFAGLSPVQDLTATPYASRARTSGSAESVTGFVGTSNIATNAVTSVQILNNTIASADLNVASFSNTFWKVDGNSGTTGGVHFVGTTDNQPLDFRANNTRVFRFEPDAISPKVVGGYNGNIATAGAYGSVIGGGGFALNINRVERPYTAILGGSANTNIGDGSFIGAGFRNSIQADAYNSVLVGGVQNTIQIGATVAAIGGGQDNVIGVSSTGSVVGGGLTNFIGVGSFYCVIGGGNANVIQQLIDYAKIGGGQSNSVAFDHGTVGGGLRNSASGGPAPTVGGGQGNSAGGHWTTISGGFSNTAIGFTSTIGGGSGNNIETNADHSVIDGGLNNRVQRFSFRAAIGGGELNLVGTNVLWATIGGGRANTVLPASGYGAIPGGQSNTVATLGFAAGNSSRAINQGAFVWNDSIGTPTASTNNDSVTMRSRGGYRLFSDGGTNGVYLAPGGGAWINMSDRRGKENFKPIDAGEILDKVAALPLETWNYKSQDHTIRHLGPMAQDFRAAFQLGETENGIATIDADGVALAAIQGLSRKTEDRSQKAEARIQKLELENEDLKSELAKLKQLVGALANKAK